MDGYITIGTKLDTKGFDAQIAKVEDDLKEIEFELSREKELKLNSREVSEYRAKAEKLKNTLVDLRKKQDDLNNASMKNLEKSIGNVSKKANSVIAGVGKWALAIFSVRTAYGVVSGAMSTLSQYDEGLKADLEYMRFAVAVALKPVIEFIVNLAYKLLGIVRAIGLTLFNFDIFSEATAENFKKIQGNASKLKKTLAGFDEMNVLNSASSGGGGGITPSGNFEIDENVVNIIKKIKKAYKEMQTALNDPEQFREAFGAWGTFFEGITRMVYSLFQSVDGTWKFLVGVFTGDTKKIKEGVRIMIESILNLILGAGQIIVGLLQGLIYEIGSAIYSIFSAIGSGIATLISNSIIFAGEMATKLGKFVKQKIIDPIGRYYEGLWTSLKKGGFKGLINYFIECWEKAINWIGEKFFSILNKIKIKVPDWLAGAGIGAFSVNIKYKPVSLPRLAKGTILNNPGQGVLVGGKAIAGEAGREAYLPLSDTQLLEELGSTIGKYITINARIENSMNGRLISRELKKINAESDFAFNR